MTEAERIAAGLSEAKVPPIGAMVLSAILTLIALTVLAAISPKAAIIVTPGGFALLLVRFVWLVWWETTKWKGEGDA